MYKKGPLRFALFTPVQTNTTLAEVAQAQPENHSRLTAPYRGPSSYQSRSQYYDVLNHFLADGVRVRRYGRFKRIADKRGWGQPEWREGLEIDRAKFYEWHIPEAGARLNELANDGCEIVSYQKSNPPHGMVTYILIGWPTNAELERNRAIRTAKKRPKQSQFPRSATPFQPSERQIAPGDSTDWYERQHGPRPKPEHSSTELPLFDAVMTPEGGRLTYEESRELDSRIGRDSDPGPLFRDGSL
jgi:hypothetical protein